MKLKTSAQKENISEIKGKYQFWKIYLTMIPQTSFCSPTYINKSCDSTPVKQTI